MHSLTFLLFPMMTSQLTINRYVDTFVPQTLRYTYPFYRIDNIVKWS